MGLEQDGLRAYPPVREVVHHNSVFYTLEAFHYDAALDVYICPQGRTLTRWANRLSSQAVGYRAAAEDCNACPVRTACTSSSEGRTITRPYAQPYLERVKGYYETEAYRKAMRKRKVWIEPKFGELKQWHQGDKFRLRRLRKVNIEGLLKAAGQNIKQLLKAKIWQNSPKPPATVAAIRAVPALFQLNCVFERSRWVICKNRVMYRNVLFNTLYRNSFKCYGKITFWSRCLTKAKPLYRRG